MTPLVSICLPNLNKVRFIEERIHSIARQTYDRWECLVCDGFSDDGSFEILKQWADSDPRVQLESAPREGIYPAWNRCLQAAKGDYVYIATSDDTMEPNCLETAVLAMEQTPEADWCHFPVQRIDEYSRPIAHPIRFAPSTGYYGDWMWKPHLRDGDRESLRMFAMGSIYQSVTGMLFRNGPYLRFPYEYQELGDYFFYLHGAVGRKILYLPRALASWRVYSGQATLGTVDRLNKLRPLMESYAQAQEEPRRTQLSTVLHLNRYLSLTKIRKARFGKLFALAMMPFHRFGRKELELRARRVPYAEHQLARVLIGLEDLVPAKLANLPETEP